MLELREQLLQQLAQIRMIAIARGFMIHQVRHHRVDQLDTGVGELNVDAAPILGMKLRDKSRGPEMLCVSYQFVRMKWLMARAPTTLAPSHQRWVD